MGTASYPKSLVNWTDRVNGQIIWAADPNSLAYEIQALEQYVGINPQTETGVPTGSPKTYANMSQRLTAAMLQTDHPYIDLNLTNFGVNWQTSSGFNNIGNFAYLWEHPPFHVKWDTDDYFDGTCITVKAQGLYLITMDQQWEWRPDGWVRCCHAVNNQVRRQHHFNYGDFPSGSNYYGQTYQNESAFTSITHFAILNPGDVVRVLLGNATDKDDLIISESNWRAYYLRPISI